MFSRRLEACLCQADVYLCHYEQAVQKSVHSAPRFFSLLTLVYLHVSWESSFGLTERLNDTASDPSVAPFSIYGVGDIHGTASYTSRDDGPAKARSCAAKVHFTGTMICPVGGQRDRQAPGGHRREVAALASLYLSAKERLAMFLC